MLPDNTLIFYKNLPFYNMLWTNITGTTVTHDLNYTFYSNSLYASIIGIMPIIFWGEGVQKIQLETEDRENGDLEALVP